MLDKHSPVPLHIQLYDILKQQIQEGQYQAHQLIPSENELSKQYDISRTTVRNVILRLANEQLIYRVPGKGTFVSEGKITTATISQKGIREQLEEMGYETDTVTLGKRIVKADEQIARSLHVQEGEAIIEIKRLRYVSNTPFSYHTNFLSAARFPHLLEQNIDELPLCDILEARYGTKAKFGEETLESITTNSLESKHLEVPVGFHVLLTECLLFDQQDVPYEFSKTIFRGDRVKLKFKFDRL